MAQFGERAAVRCVPDAARRAMAIALDELLTNVITHAWSDGRAHIVSVRIEFHGDRLEAELADDGQPFDPLSQPAPATQLPLRQRRAGGLGIHLVRSLMDGFTYRRDGGRNLVHLVKRWETGGLAP